VRSEIQCDAIRTKRSIDALIIIILNSISRVFYKETQHSQEYIQNFKMEFDKLGRHCEHDMCNQKVILDNRCEIMLTNQSVLNFVNVT
jgi:hypothetical protein